MSKQIMLEKKPSYGAKDAMLNNVKKDAYLPEKRPTLRRRKERMTGGQSPTGSTQSCGSNGLRDSPVEKGHLPASNLFVYPLQKKYICLDCEGLLWYPVQIKPCGHRVCTKCYTKLLSSSARCPGCMDELNENIPDIDKAFHEEIQELDVKCRNVEWNCKWEGCVNEFSSHVEKCDYSDILCENDCGAKFQRRFLTKHLDKDCPEKLITCLYCDEKHLRKDKKGHLENCPLLPCPCPNKCDKKLTIHRCELDSHVENDCPRTKLMCEYEVLGCGHRGSREKMPKHNKTNIIAHVKMVADLALKNKELIMRFSEKLSEHGTLIEKHEKRLNDLEKIAHSQLIWRIEDYTRKMKEAKAGNTDTLFSPTFTTSKHGYRLCASVCLNGDGKGKGTHMSVFISVLKGAFDALLKWPFDYRVTFVLLDQNDDPAQRKHIRFSIKPNPCADNEPFLGRPRLEKNASFGGAKFAKHEEIVSRNYIKEDTIFLKISVDCDGLSEP
ncbi:TNF receptor-associated factor 4 isoform X2 [Nematostella vectensis]|uniref:TNF receptor-associated factor 4 isoform X2 n=1 Tax=Nematostella vectensis TaxID=45351 RepID=UPI00138FE714|nr:TNF receptor-associated factor 4 isoform X2 [Nematostella vectensis]